MTLVKRKTVICPYCDRKHVFVKSEMASNHINSFPYRVEKIYIPSRDEITRGYDCDEFNCLDCNRIVSSNDENIICETKEEI